MKTENLEMGTGLNVEITCYKGKTLFKYINCWVGARTDYVIALYVNMLGCGESELRHAARNLFYLFDAAKYYKKIRRGDYISKNARITNMGCYLD